jgi:hypothetical protein
MLGKKAAALRECNGVRVHPANPIQIATRHRDQVVANPQQRFALDSDIVNQEKVIVLSDRTCEGVFDRDHGRVNLLRGQGMEDFSREGARQDGCLG